MPTLILPQASKSASNATVLRWRKRAGDAVRKGEVLVELETDEGLWAIESALDGTLSELLVPVGKCAAVGSPLAIIDGGRAQKPSQPPKPATSSTEVPMKPSGKVVPVLMPKAGQSMEEGVIVKWHVQPGATVQKGMVLFEIETDKSTMEVEATDEGRLARIVVPESASSPVLLPVAYLAENDADLDAFIAAGGGATTLGTETASHVPIADGGKPEEISSAPAAMTEAGRLKASPAARKLAAGRGVDLATVTTGSGPGGRILSTDIPQFQVAKSAPKAETLISQGELPPGAVRKRMSGMRKAIARNLTLSKTTIPHFYVKSRINAEAMMTFYRSQKVKAGCSVNDIIIMACAKAIMDFPAMHSRVDGETVIEFPGANIGIAVGMEDGLAVPVLLNAQEFTLPQLAVETKRLANQARAGKIENMGQGIFTISNLGMFGVDEFSAIINPPEASILAVSAVREDVIVKDGALKAGQTMSLTLSADHRLIDGTLGAQFMARLKALLENPIQLIA